MNDEDHYCENCGMDLYGMGPVYVDYMDMPYCSIDCLAERNTYRKYKTIEEANREGNK
ncbi:hypothetical protein QP094_05690 [Lactobacillus jensenii]|jgi:hypothetical protein|uniref:Uncharacterized protein n=3 Tax=Lactobacillus TaxID=1578 RepID=A0ABU9FHC0_LACJE|nr:MULTISPECIES: hypothetical protein [Lactobacillus]ERJ42940.1 hypothetical protein N581_09950 [Lactobacillus jensenii MD IIE-70(2)]MCZ3543293.1 hypothetical protein [Lactobacillus gasseri]EEX28222.1 hypothetical protein HMPREF0527_00457 [Lactobacillus jensenii SJ-7A-US]MCF1843065.1 hypothetical protein [Lactobacillus jensenii]MCW8071157.1 hypothetical protein [Lactobacillus jensenii]